MGWGFYVKLLQCWVAMSHLVWLILCSMSPSVQERRSRLLGDVPPGPSKGAPGLMPFRADGLPQRGLHGTGATWGSG